MKPKYKFPKKFLWGASTSAHQVEGGNHNQWSVWELKNARSLANQAKYQLKDLPIWPEIKNEATNPSNYVSGRAIDHYHRYEDDFDLLVALNMNSFRFSIEWSRIEPREGEWNEAEIEHYRDYLKALQVRGIEPLVTMFHWTMPVWFDEMGGFEKHRNIRYFVRFCEKVFDELGDLFRYVCTFNEPEVYVAFGWLHEGEWPPSKKGQYLLGYWTYRNISSAHNLVYRMAHKKVPHLRLATTKNVAHHYLGDNKLSSRLSRWFTMYMEDYLYFNRIKRHMDWMGVNYYFSNRYLAGNVHNENDHIQDLGWEMKPDDLEHVLERLYRKYRKPIMITECGVADRNDQYRKWWIAHTINAVHNAIHNGVKVQGYCHWSLLDNFEWAYGKWPRFGLVAVDYRTMERTPRSSALWFGKVIKNLRRSAS